jgi:hypothetical protein
VTDGPPDEIHGSSRYEWERIVRRVQMPPSVKCVAFALATYANTDGTSIYPGNERLAAVTCQGDKTVRRALAWLRGGYLVERVREGSRGGRGGFADEYRLTIPSDLLARHVLLDPDESPVAVTGDSAPDRQEHRSQRPVAPVAESRSPVTESPNTGHRDRTPTQYQPLPIQDQRDHSVRDVTAGADDPNLYARLVAIDELAKRRRGA